MQETIRPNQQYKLGWGGFVFGSGGGFVWAGRWMDGWMRGRVLIGCGEGEGEEKTKRGMITEQWC